MGFFTVHFDDSGTHPESSVAVCGCWIADVEQWECFCRDWQDASEQEEFGVFHMADFYQGKEQFSVWRDDRKRRVLNRLCTIIKTRVHRGCGFGVRKRDYEQP
jgi:hypothetical protein